MTEDLDHQLTAFLRKICGGVFDDRHRRAGAAAGPVNPDISLGNLREVSGHSAGHARVLAESAGNILPLELQEPLCDLPTAVHPADQIGLRYLHVLEERFAKRALVTDESD